MNQARAGQVRVLVVDDDEEDYETVRELLAEADDGARYVVDWEQSYESGLWSLTQDQHDVCLLDYLLGPRDGLDLLLQATKAGTLTPIIFLTGRANDGIEQQALLEGAADYLVKGKLDTDALERAIRHSLERSRRIDELKRRERRFRSVFEGALDAMLIVDDDMRCIDGNRAALALLGVELQQLPALTVRDISSAEQRGTLADSWRKFLQNGTLEGEFQVRRTDGSKRTVEFRAAANIAPNRHLSVMRDITERRAMEQQRLRLAAMVESAADAIEGITLEGRIEYWSPAAERLYGLAATEALGQSKHVLVPASKHSELDEMLARVRGGEAVQDRETLRLRSDGTLFDASVTMSPVHEGGAIVAAVVLTRDISDKKRLEAQLALSDRMASIGALAAGVAHEINNPLAALIADLSMALDRVADGAGAPATGTSETTAHGPADELSGLLLDVRSSAERIRQVVQDLRLFSRPDEVKTGPIDVQRVMESALKLARNEVRHRAKLVKDYKPVAAVHGSDGRLGQVFLNLIINAAQAIREGDADSHEIRVTTRMDDHGRVVCEVSDTGCGIPKHARDHLFDPFFTTKPMGIGTGLGLSICRRIVTEHGGSIEVVDNPSRGTTFRVLLPPSEHSLVARITEAPPAQAAGVAVRRRVLLIDDDERVIQSLQRMLNREHDVTATTSALAALELLEREAPFDVIVCDMMMPQMTGMEFHAALHARSSSDADRVVFLTGGAFTEEAQAFLERFPERFVDKPFDVPRLKHMIARGLPNPR